MIILIVALLLLNLLASAALWLWIDHRLTEIDEMFKVLALGIRKAKEEIIDQR